jgi:UDP-glucose 4-epimerase
MRVFVTGSSSHLAQSLLPQLCAHPDVAGVTGVDLVQPRFGHPKFVAHRLDIRSPQITDLLAGHDALVHLAFVVLRGRMSEAEMFDINVRGSHRVFHAAHSLGLARLVHMSSAAVYGAGVHLDENAPLAPLPRFLYAQHQTHLEQLLAIEFPACVRLRPHVVLGPHAQPVLRRLLNQPCYVSLPEPHPLLQCVHEDDVARAVLACLEKPVRGPFNLAVDDNFSFRDAIRARRRVRVPLPRVVARGALTLAGKAFGWGGEPAWIEGITHTLLINCRRARIELGWRSSFTAAEVLAQT